MKRNPLLRRSGFTVVELMITLVVASAIGLVICSVLYTNMILAAKNSIINSTHQEARIARLNMLVDLRSSVSAPFLTDSSGSPYATTPSSGFAEGIGFQKWAADSSSAHSGQPMKPFKVYADAYGTDQTAKTAQNYILIAVPNTWSAPSVGQGLILPTHQIEADIKAVASASGAPSGTTGYKVTLYNFRDGSSIIPSNNSNLPVSILGTASTQGDVVCFVTERCSYTVNNGVLALNYRGNAYPIGATNITNSTPFYMPSSVTGGSFALSSTDAKDSQRGYRSGNVLLNGQVPIKSQLTSYQ